MPGKNFVLEGIGDITINKRTGSRNMRLSLVHDGSIRLTIPAWMPYRLGVEFTRQKAAWIAKNRHIKPILDNGSIIGKAHKLQYLYSKAAESPRVIVKNNLIKVFLPAAMETSSGKAQAAAERGAVKALKLEAERLLPQRLSVLARRHGFDYRSVTIKRLKSRWGSCNQDKDIVLNLFLMQLPWTLIDYVILHELTHTKIMAHGEKFWTELGRHVDDLGTIRKTLRRQQPVLLPASIESMA